MHNDKVYIGALDHECTVFAQYLTNEKPNSYVLAKYSDAHGANEIFHDSGPFDTFLIDICRKGAFATRLVDAYTSVFCRGSVVRKKMVLLVAILENCSPTHRYFESLDSEGKARLCIRMLWVGIGCIVALVSSIIMFMPWHAGFAIRSRRPGKIKSWKGS